MMLKGMVGRESSFPLGGTVTGTGTMETNVENSQLVKLNLPYDLSSIIPCLYPKGNLTKEIGTGRRLKEWEGG